MTGLFSEYEEEIDKVKGSLVVLQEEIDAFSFMSDIHKNDINNLLLERAWGLLEVRRKTYAEMRALQARLNKEQAKQKGDAIEPSNLIQPNSK